MNSKYKILLSHIGILILIISISYTVKTNLSIQTILSNLLYDLVAFYVLYLIFHRIEKIVQIEKGKEIESRHIDNFIQTLLPHMSRGYGDVLMMTNKRESVLDDSYEERKQNFNPLNLIHFYSEGEYAYHHELNTYDLAIYDFLRIEEKIGQIIDTALLATSWKHNSKLYNFLRHYRKIQINSENNGFDEYIKGLNNLWKKHGKGSEWDQVIYNDIDEYIFYVKNDKTTDSHTDEDMMLGTFYYRMNNFLKLKEFIESYSQIIIEMKSLDPPRCVGNINEEFFSI